GVSAGSGGSDPTLTPTPTLIRAFESPSRSRTKSRSRSLRQGLRPPRLDQQPHRAVRVLALGEEVMAAALRPFHHVVDVQRVADQRLDERLGRAFDLPGERRQHARAVLAPAVDDHPAIAIAVGAVRFAVAHFAAGAHVDLTADAPVQLPLEP